MKKATILFLFIFLIGNSLLVRAETFHHHDPSEIQATNPGILINLVTPTVNQAVKEEHGDKATWTPDRITKLSINHDHTVKPPKSWYVIKMNIHVQSPDSKHVDLVILKIETKTDLGKSLQNKKLEDASITRLEYIHDVKQ
jgi:hypothetical protein